MPTPPKPKPVALRIELEEISPLIWWRVVVSDQWTLASLLAGKGECEDALAACGGLRSLTAARVVIGSALRQARRCHGGSALFPINQVLQGDCTHVLHQGIKYKNSNSLTARIRRRLRQSLPS